MAASEHPPDTESPLRRLVPSDQIMLSPSCSSPCWLWGCSLPPPTTSAACLLGLDMQAQRGRQGHRQLTARRCLESSSFRAFWVSQTSSSARCRSRARACSCFCWSSCREGPASGPWPQPAPSPPPPPPLFGKRAGGATSKNRRGPQRTPVLAGCALGILGQSDCRPLLPPSLPACPAKGCSCKPCNDPHFRASSSAQLLGCEGWAPLPSDRKGQRDTTVGAGRTFRAWRKLRDFCWRSEKCLPGSC